MKKLNYLLGFIVISALLFSPFLKMKLNDNNIKVSVNETQEEYRFEAHFSKDKSDTVNQYMDEYLNQKIFENAEVDAELTLKDRTKIYAKTEEGAIEIRLNKQTNSRNSYKKIKQMGEGIKRILTKK